MTSTVFPIEREASLESTPRFKAELSKLEELPRGFVYCTRKHAFGVVIEITLKEGRFPNLSVLNKGRDIVFDIFLRSCYPFSSPQVFCATEFSVPRLNDRRNFLYCLVRHWGPAIMLDDLALKLPDFLTNIAKHIKDCKFLHEIGEYSEFEPCYEEDFAMSCADIFPCTKITKRLLNPKIEMVMILTDSRILLTQPTEKKGELKIVQMTYLDEIVSFDQVSADRYVLIFKDQQNKPILQFAQGKSKQMVLSLRNRMGLLQGSVTGLTAESVQLKVTQLIRLTKEKPQKQILQKLVNCLSDCIELFSEEDEAKFKRYKGMLDQLLKDKVYQRILFEEKR